MLDKRRKMRYKILEKKMTYYEAVDVCNKHKYWFLPDRVEALNFIEKENYKEGFWVDEEIDEFHAFTFQQNKFLNTHKNFKQKVVVLVKEPKIVKFIRKILKI